MNWIVAIVSAVALLLMGVMFFAMPSLTRPTIPLGVSVPSERVGDPVVIGAVKRYRVGVAVVASVSLVLAVAFAAVAPVAATVIPILVMLVGVLAVYLSSRRTIQRAKHDGDWYRDVPVRLTATITAPPRERSAPALAWYVGGTVVLMAAVVVGALVYDTLPDPVPVHWNAGGVANGYAPKGIWSVFGPVLLGFAMIVLLYLLAIAIRRTPVRSVASDTPDTAARIAIAQGSLMQGLLGQIAFLLSLEFAAIAITSWLAPGSQTLILVSTIVLPALLLAVVLVFLLRYRSASMRARAGDATAGASGTRRTADAPDDDRYWKAGSIYVNRSDPALMVPKRFGVGWTINMGHPAGIAIGIVTLVLIVGVIVLAIATGSHTAGARY